MVSLCRSRIGLWDSHRASRAAARGVTLVELLVMVLLVTGIVIGASIGCKQAAEEHFWWRLGGLVLGAIVGGSTVMGGVYLLLLPSTLLRALRRVREPADLYCRCNESGGRVDEVLLPSTPLAREAIARSREWSQSLLLTRLHLDRAPAADKLQARLNAGTLKQEQLALAATLGEPAAVSLAAPLRNPIARYRHWAKLPRDFQLVLRSGVPPRLSLVWAMMCAARTLSVFENEFHQDTRPRQYLGLGYMALGDNTPERGATLEEEWKRIRRSAWDSKLRGCRVLHRTFWQRFRGDESAGERASGALFTFAADAISLLDPDRLWHVYPRGDMARAYLTAHNRCAWTSPSFIAEDVAFKASRAFASPDEEFARQRSELARMILAWEHWDEDREVWRRRVEQEWIPKIEAAGQELGFNVPAYIAELRRTHLPWIGAESE